MANEPAVKGIRLGNIYSPPDYPKVKAIRLGMTPDLVRLGYGCVGHWKLDESSTYAVDSSGSGNSGTYLPAATPPISDYPATVLTTGRSLYFSGSNDVDVPTSASIQLTSNFSFSCWIKPTSVTQVGIAGKYLQGSTYKGWSMYISNGSIYLKLRKDASNYLSKYTTETVTTDAWHHIAFTYVGDGSQPVVYLDGSATTLNTSESVGNALNGIGDSGTSLLLGYGNSWGTGYYFSGSIDDCRLYNTAISSGDITSLYTNSSPPTPTAGWWKFDEWSKAHDYSGFGNDGAWVANPTPTASVPTVKFYDPYALSFSRASSQYITRTLGTALYRTTGYSITGWVKAAVDTTNNPCIYSETGVGSQIFRVAQGGAGGDKLNIYLRNDAGGTPMGASGKTSTTTLFDNTWHHFAYTDSNGTAKCYIDGVLDATDFSYTPSGSYTFTTAQMGRRGTTDYYNGTMDDIRIYNRVLTATEITKLAQGHSPEDKIMAGTLYAGTIQ
jgi:hypothetical protein